MDPFGIDPERTVLISTNAATVQGSRLLQNGTRRQLENHSLRQLEGSGTSGDPFEIDPERTVLITSGLTSSD